jgi:hypothetical protein
MGGRSSLETKIVKSRQNQVFDLMMEIIKNEFIFSSLNQSEQKKYFEIMQIINSPR